MRRKANDTHNWFAAPCRMEGAVIRASVPIALSFTSIVRPNARWRRRCRKLRLSSGDLMPAYR